MSIINYPASDEANGDAGNECGYELNGIWAFVAEAVLYFVDITFLFSSKSVYKWKFQEIYYILLYTLLIVKSTRPICRRQTNRSLVLELNWKVSCEWGELV